QVGARAAITVGRIPAQRARSGSSAGEQLDRGIARDPDSVVLALVEHHLGENREVGGAGKEPSVPGDAAQGPSVLVVDFALDGVASRRGDLGRGATGPQRV